jgi:hypothetical protein
VAPLPANPNSEVCESELERRATGNVRTHARTTSAAARAQAAPFFFFFNIAFAPHIYVLPGPYVSPRQLLREV